MRAYVMVRADIEEDERRPTAMLRIARLGKDSKEALPLPKKEGSLCEAAGLRPSAKRYVARSVRGR